MKKSILAGVLTIGISAAALANPAQARCEDSGNCGVAQFHRAVQARTSGVRHHRAVASLRHRQAQPVSTASQGSVVALIQTMAPRYGVPTWFALRIAKVESGFNANARGSHGELGVFQMKCPTARSIGYRGNCAGLLNASTGVEFGLKHLALAIRSSGGNLQLAASKHNGGLARRGLVPSYVAQVF